jgi:plastocyanin
MRNLKHSTVIALAFTGLMGMAAGASAAEVVVDQKDKSFQSGGAKINKLTINNGDTIRFKNEDPFFHNIFSLSDLKTFDLGSFPKGESKTVTFDKSGLIQIECAIHPEMLLELTVK